MMYGISQLSGISFRKVKTEVRKIRCFDSGILPFGIFEGLSRRSEFSLIPGNCLYLFIDFRLLTLFIQL